MVRLSAPAPARDGRRAADQLGAAGLTDRPWKRIGRGPASDYAPIAGSIPDCGRETSHPSGWRTQLDKPGMACNSRDMSAADPMLVMRRHVDFLRVRSA